MSAQLNDDHVLGRVKVIDDVLERPGRVEAPRNQDQRRPVSVAFVVGERRARRLGRALDKCRSPGCCEGWDDQCPDSPSRLQRRTTHAVEIGKPHPQHLTVCLPPAKAMKRWPLCSITCG